MDVLILAVSAGGGHLRAAEALKEALAQKFPGSRCLLVDTLKYINPVIDKLVVASYVNTLKKTPRIYQKLYEMSEAGESLSDFGRTINKLLSYRIDSLISEFKPAVTVCTHPFPLQMMSDLKKKNRVSVPTVAVLTDFVLHSYWIHDHIDAYVVAHDFIKRQMVNRGVPEEIVYPFGIPVSASFLQKADKEKVLNELGFENKLTILIMGGSLGFGEIRSTFLSLLKSKKDLQVIVLCGKNSNLKRQLEKFSFNTDKKAKIIGYTDRVPEFMDISDFIITKPGGLTIAEALVKELPIFIISPIPGQEEGNANFLVNNGVAARLYSRDYIDDILHQIIDNPLRVKHMKEMVRYLARPNSSGEVVNLLEKLVYR